MTIEAPTCNTQSPDASCVGRCLKRLFDGHLTEQGLIIDDPASRAILAASTIDSSISILNGEVALSDCTEEGCQGSYITVTRGATDPIEVEVLNGQCQQPGTPAPEDSLAEPASLLEEDVYLLSH